MNTHHRSLLLLFVSSVLSLDQAEAREQYKGVIAVVAEAVNGALERRVDDPEQVAIIVQEVNAVRRKNWSSFQGKLGACAVRLSFYGNDGRVGVLVLQADELLELGSNRTSGYKRELSTFEAQATRRLAAHTRKPSQCKA
jgi:chemotaxis signal transduction protein